MSGAAKLEQRIDQVAASRGDALEMRLAVLDMIHRSKASHVGSNFSIADIVAVLYRSVLRVTPSTQSDPLRDRFILSKGHAAAVLYAALAVHGFITHEELETFYMDGTRLAGHAMHGVPGVELSTGSLGHGLPVGTGLALGLLNSADRPRVVVLMSDGECDEGTTWESALFAAHNRLSNLTVVIDYNKLQSLGPVANTLGLEPFGAKWSAFGWHVLGVDGHDHQAIVDAFALGDTDPRPTVIIADTVKGKGVSFMENSVEWHYRCPDEFDVARARRELVGS